MKLIERIDYRAIDNVGKFPETNHQCRPVDGRGGAIQYTDARFLSGQGSLSDGRHRILGPNLCGEIIAVSETEIQTTESTVFQHSLILISHRCEAKMLYLLARPKKGKSSMERMADTFTGALFTSLAKQQPDYMERVQVVEGDTRELDVGLSNEAQAELCENVDIILHAAADVRFDNTLLELSLVNLRGTREMLRLAERCKKLQMFAYISTAFSHCVRTKVEEKFYEAPISAEQMIRIAEHFEASGNSDMLDVLTERFVSPWPNTYSFSKALSEELIRDYGDRVPAVIIRPSISEYLIEITFINFAKRKEKTRLIPFFAFLQ